MAQNTPATPPHGIAALPPDRGTLRLRPHRLEPPMAMNDYGLACPVTLPAISRSRRISPPAPSTTSPLTLKPYMSNESAHPGAAPFSPLSTGSTCRCPRPAVAAEALSLPSPSTTIALDCVEVPTPSCSSSSDRGMRIVGYRLSARTIGLVLIAAVI